MDEKQVIKLFLRNGFQLSKGALGLVSKEPEIILSRLKKITPRPFIITEQHIKNVLKETPKKSAQKKVKKEHSSSEALVHVDDVVKKLHSRYEETKSLLLKQITPKKLVSINKITPRTIVFSVVGLIREKNDNSILIEDPTGETNLYFDEDMKKELKHILLDDVVVVRCKKIKEKYHVKKVFTDKTRKKSAGDSPNTSSLLNQNI